MKLQIKFMVAPRPGDVELALDDQIYRLVEVRPYVRKIDGQPTELLVWRSNCPDCDDEITVTSSKSNTHRMNRRCEDCAQAGQPVKRRRGWGRPRRS